MKDDHDKEDRVVTRAFAASVGALGFGALLAICGSISVATASATDVNSIAGGWTAIGAGFIIGLIGGTAAYNAGMIMRRNREHHEAVMGAVDKMREAMSPVDEVDLQRRQGSS